MASKRKERIKIIKSENMRNKMLLTTTTPALHIELKRRERKKHTYDNACIFIYNFFFCMFLVLV